MYTAVAVIFDNFTAEFAHFVMKIYIIWLVALPGLFQIKNYK